MPEGIELRTVDEIPTLDWNGFRYNLKLYDANKSIVENNIDTVLSYAGGKEGHVQHCSVLLKTTARMRLYASNDGGTGIDTIPPGEILRVQEIKLRNNSKSTYYVKVKSTDGNYDGWVSLGSSHYDLYTRGMALYSNVPATSADGTCIWYADKGITYRF